jgi:hypothetical protein
VFLPVFMHLFFGFRVCVSASVSLEPLSPEAHGQRVSKAIAMLVKNLIAATAVARGLLAEEVRHRFSGSGLSAGTDHADLRTSLSWKLGRTQ